MMNRRSLIICIASVLSVATCRAADTKTLTLGSVNQTAVATELKTVKLYGAGGVAGLDAYQSGFFISETGNILTVWSTVLDLDTVIAVTSDGKRMEAKVVGVDPNLEIAVLSTDKPTGNFFDITQTTIAKADPPQAGEVKAKIAACAICHSDVHWVRGEWGGATPVVAPDSFGSNATTEYDASEGRTRPD